MARFEICRAVDNHESLCWDCCNAVPNKAKNIGCPWSIEFKPVPGWVAKRKVWRNSYGYLVYSPNCYESFRVIACPMFEPESYSATTAEQNAERLQGK